MIRIKTQYCSHKGQYYRYCINLGLCVDSAPIWCPAAVLKQSKPNDFIAQNVETGKLEIWDSEKKGTIKVLQAEFLPDIFNVYSNVKSSINLKKFYVEIDKLEQEILDFNFKTVLDSRPVDHEIDRKIDGLLERMRHKKHQLEIEGPPRPKFKRSPIDFLCEQSRSFYSTLDHEIEPPLFPRCKIQKKDKKKS